MSVIIQAIADDELGRDLYGGVVDPEIMDEGPGLEQQCGYPDGCRLMFLQLLK